MPDTKSTEVSKVRPFETVVSNIQGEANLNTGFGGETTAMELTSAAIDKMSEATDLDGILAVGEVDLAKAEDYAWKPITVTEVEMAKPQEKYREGGIGAFAIVKATLDDGEPIQFSVGAPNVVAPLYLIRTRGLLPARVMIRAKETGGGTLLTLGRPDAKKK